MRHRIVEKFYNADGLMKYEVQRQETMFGEWYVTGTWERLVDAKQSIKKGVRYPYYGQVQYYDENGNREDGAINMPKSWMIFILAALLVMVAMVFGGQPAAAHDAMPTAAQPEGWTYPYQCCSGMDCRRVGSANSKDAKVRVIETDRGYMISTTKEIIPYHGDPKVKDSPDGEFHWCSQGGKDDSRTICLYVPPRGM